MSEDENTTEIEGILINFHYPNRGRENEKVRFTLEEKGQRILIEINYEVPHSYAYELKNYIEKYFKEGKTSVKVKIKGKLEENKYEYEGSGLIRKLE